MLRARAGGAAAMALGVALALAGCSGTSAPTPSATPPAKSGDGILRIGTLFSTSGDGAATASGAVAAVNAAVRAIDQAGGVRGVPVEVLTRNGGVAGDGAAEAAFTDLVERGVDVIIGPSTVEIAALLEPLAAQAGIPLISPVATGPRADAAEPGTATVFFRTVPSTAAQATYLADLLAADAPRVALLRVDDASGEEFSAALAAALAEHDAELVADVIPGPDPAADAAGIAAATPDVVVVATAGAGDDTAALLSALGSVGLGGQALWLTRGAVARYDEAAGPLTGATGILTGVAPDPAFAALVRQEDPGARNLLYSPNAYDATVLVALAAVLAEDDGGASIGFAVRAAGAGGIPCRSFGECLDTLATQSDIAYEGVSGPLVVAGNGDRESASYVRYGYDDANVPVVVANAGK